MNKIIAALFFGAVCAHAACTVTFTVGATNLSTLACGAQNYFDNAAPAPGVMRVSYFNAAGTRQVGTPIPTSTSNTATSLTQNFPWGTVVFNYSASGNSFNTAIQITSTLTSQTIDQLYLLSSGILLPSTPPSVPALTEFGADQPTAIWMGYTEGSICLVNPDVGTSLGVGMYRVHSNSDTEWNVLTEIDNNQPSNYLSTSFPAINRPIAPLGTVTWNVSVIFGNLNPSTTVPQSTIQQLAGPTFAAFNAAVPATYPVQIFAQPIADLHDTHNVRPTCATNPRGWQFFPIATCSWDTTTPSGIAAFQAAWIADAQSNVAAMDAAAAAGVRPRGIVFWDWDGQQFDTAFIGDPTQIETISPETAGGTMDTVVNTFINAGYEVGFTLRPQTYSQQSSVVNLSGRTLTFVSGAQFNTAWLGNPLLSLSIWLGGNIRMNFAPNTVSSGTSMTLVAPDCGPSGGSGSAYTCSSGSSNSTQSAIAFTPDVNCAAGAITINPGGGIKSLKQSDGTTDPGLNGCIAGHQYFVAYNGTVWCIFDANNIPMVESQQLNDLNAGYQVLHDKIAWCRNRWGSKANLFYVDSNLLPGNSTVLYPASAYRQLLADWPGILIFPEQESTANWGAGVPYTDVRNYDPTNNSYVEALAADFAVYPNAQGIVQVDDTSCNNATFFQAITTAILHNQFMMYNVAPPLTGNCITLAIPYYKALYSHPKKIIK